MKARPWLWLEVAVPVAVIAALWFWTAESSTYYFPPLSETLETFVNTWLAEKARTDLLPSLARLAIGLALGLGAGIVGGVALGRVRRLAAICAPVIEFFRAIPAPAIVPVLLLVIGIGDRSQVTLIAFGTVWPVILSTIDGVRSVDATVLDTGRSYQVRQRDQLTHIVLPAAAPQIFAGIKTSLSLGIILMVISEMVGSINGIGFSVLRAQRQFAMPEMWAGIILLGLLGFAMNAGFELVERRVLAWHRGLKSRTV